MSSHLNTQLFFMDNADSPGVTDPASSNNRLLKRAKLIRKTKDLQEPISHNLFSMSRYKINKVDVKIKITEVLQSFAYLLEIQISIA